MTTETDCVSNKIESEPEEEKDDTQLMLRLVGHLTSFDRRVVRATSDNTSSSWTSQLYKDLSEMNIKTANDDSRDQEAVQHGMRSLHAFISERSGTDLHATVVEALFVVADDDSSTASDNTTTIDTIISLLVMACVALDMAPIHPTTGALQVRHSRRWQSFVWETIRLFQRQFNSFLQQYQQQTSLNILEWLSLWTRVIIPSTHRLQLKLLQHSAAAAAAQTATTSATATCPSMAAYQAAVAATCSRLARVLVEHVSGDTPQIQLQASPLLDDLTQAIDSTLSDGEEMILYSLDFDFDPVNDVDDCDDTKKDFRYWLRRSDGHDHDVAGMEMLVDTIGLAVLACRHAEHCRPDMNLPLQQQQRFDVWVPHVNVLLSATEDDVLENAYDWLDDAGGDDSRSVPFAQAAATRYQDLGIQFLDELLQKIPAESLSLPANVHGEETLQLVAPLPVLGLLQLLSNRIAHAAMNQTHSDAATHRCQETFQLLQRIVTANEPTSQVYLVSQLTMTCPFPQLRPRILDLLRVVSQWSDSESTMRAMQDLWTFLDTFMLRELESHFDDGHCHRPEDVLESIELYVSAMNLIYRAISANHGDSNIPELQARLKRILGAMEVCLSSWSRGHEEPPDQWFRLNLLEMAVQKVLEQLVALPASHAP